MASFFSRILKGKVIIVGIGNILRGDDGLGPHLIAALKGKTDRLCFDAGTAPENYLGKIAKEEPDTVLLVDAVHLDKKAGEFEILKEKDITDCGFSTHDLSPARVMEYLKETGASIYLLGIQPKNTAFGEELSPEVKKTVEEIAGLIGPSV